MERIMKKIVLFAFLITSGVFGQEYWTRLTGLPMAEVTQAIETPSGAIFAAINTTTTGYFLYKKDAGASTFLKVNIAIPTRVTYLFLSNSGTMFAGLLSGGLYSSSDEGNTWSAASILNVSNVSCIAENNSGAIFVCAGGALYSRLDAGSSWTTRIPATSGIKFITNDGGMYASGDKTIYHSSDNGLTWTLKHTLNIQSGITSLLFSQEKLYVTTGGDGVFLSTDQGTTFSPLNQGFGSLNVKSLLADSSGNLLAGCADGVYSKPTGSTSWSLSLADEGRGFGYLGRRGSGVVLASTLSNGIWYSGDYGNSWNHHFEGLPGIVVNSFCETPSGKVFAALGKYGLFMSSDRGITWSHADNGVGYPANRKISAVSTTTQGTLFVADANSGVYRSTNEGVDWTEVGDTVLPPGFIGILQFDQNELLGFFSGKGVYKSFDDGITWAPIYLFPLNMMYGFAKTREGAVLLSASLRIHRSTDRGVTWTLVNSSIETRGFVSFPNEVVVAGGTKFPFLVRSTNGGLEWQALTYMEMEACNALTGNNDGVLFAGTVKGIFSSNDTMSTWANITVNIPDSNIAKVFVSSSGHVFLSTERGHVYRSIGTTSIEQEEFITPDKFTLSQNYPNPFNPETVIRFALPSSGYTKGVVYDILGREVATLLNGEMPAGEHQLKFDASGLSSGVYIFRLEAGGYSSAIKMVVEK